MKYLAIAAAAVVIIGGAWLLYSRMDNSSLSCKDRMPTVVAFGDSLVAGYGASSGEDAFSTLSRLSELPILNLGVNGDTSARALARIDSVLAEKPDIVFVLLGGNDALQSVPVSETEANLGQVLVTLKESGATPILVGVLGGFPADIYAPMFERLAKEHDVPFVPNILSGLIGRNEYMSDPIHPNAEGYARIAARLRPVLETVCGDAS